MSVERDVTGECWLENDEGEAGHSPNACEKLIREVLHGANVNHRRLSLES